MPNRAALGPIVPSEIDQVQVLLMETGNESISSSRKLLGHDTRLDETRSPFLLEVITRLDFLLRNPSNRKPLFQVGVAALNAFVQANVTGPPLAFSSEDVFYTRAYRGHPERQPALRQVLLDGLEVDGVTVYHLAPHIELFWLAKMILNQEAIDADLESKRARLRVNFVHQKLLLERADSLQRQIFADCKSLESVILSQSEGQQSNTDQLASFHIERAVVYTYYGHDAKARQDLNHAADLNGFEFRLTGRLGRRTRFQEKDTSQLVVIAKSSNSDRGVEVSENALKDITQLTDKTQNAARPTDLDLNDETLLENISFSKSRPEESFLPNIQRVEDLPPSLASIDPEQQPLLNPLDAIILLSLASSISNTNPQDGLTREETLPYVIRALQGGSSDWQVYTQALLVRSRIEGYRSRTAERGLLQLQALVDQVITETTGTVAGKTQTEATQATFLPRPKASEIASPAERLKYIWQLDFPVRWELEVELAERWATVGGLRTALDIYERLQMWAEVALCLAATEEEGKAIGVIRELLYEPSALESDGDEEAQTFSGEQKTALPADAPRLFCILGDLEKDSRHYEEAWSVSNGRYARAQRSLGRYFVKEKQFQEAADAYEKCLRVNQLSAPTWFTLGCVQLEIQDWPKAVESFTRAIQLEDSNAEAWSNLAVALLRLPPPAPPQPPVKHDTPLADEDDSIAPVNSVSVDFLKHPKEALLALRRAATLKHSDPRIWENYLTVAASIPPPETPYSEVILAQKRVIELQKKSVGEKAVDESILSMLIRHVISTPGYLDSSVSFATDQPEGPLRPSGVTRQLINLVDQDIVPIITTSSRLWLLVAQLADWRRRPLMALEAQEKAWRAATSKPGIYETQNGWNEAVEATVNLVRAYENYGPKERESVQASPIVGGREAGDGTEEEKMLVTKDWRFKARSAIRGVKGKGKEDWEDDKGWSKLEELLEELKGS